MENALKWLIPLLPMMCEPVMELKEEQLVKLETGAEHGDEEFVNAWQEIFGSRAEEAWQLAVRGLKLLNQCAVQISGTTHADGERGKTFSRYMAQAASVLDKIAEEHDLRRTDHAE